MTRLRARPRSHAGEYREGRRPRRLVDEDHAGRLETLGNRHRVGAPAQACAAGRAANAETMKAVISSIERSLEKPAACRCPPPPDFRAIAETSTAIVEERSEIFRAGLPSRGGSRISAASSRALDRAQDVDDALRVRLDRPDLAEVAAHEVRDDDPAVLVERRPIERPREELHLRELHRLVDALEDPLDVGARTRAARPRAAAPSASCSSTGSGRCRSRARRRAPPRSPGSTRRQRSEDVGEHLGGRRRLGHDEVDRSEAGVVVVMVDVDDHAARRAGARR